MKPKLLVVELWGLGDLAIASPFIRSAAEHFDVTVVSKAFGVELQREFWPGVEVLSFNAPWTKFRHKYHLAEWNFSEIAQRLRGVRRKRFEFAVSGRWDPRDHALLALTGAQERIGFGRFGSGSLLTKDLPRPYALAHRIEYWNRLGSALEISFDPLVPARPPANGKGLRVLLHSGAAQSVRVWPLQRCREVVAYLRGQGSSVRVVCDHDQLQWWHEEGGEPACTVLQSVAQLVEAIKSADLFVGNDSGPGHVAALCGVPTFTIFGPQVPQWFHPIVGGAGWIEGKPCPHKPCRDHCAFERPFCIEGITSAEVVEGLRRSVATVEARKPGYVRHDSAERLDEKPAARAADVARFRSRHPLKIIQVFNRYSVPSGEEFSVERIAQDLGSAGHEVLKFRKETSSWEVPGAPAAWRRPFLLWRNAEVLDELRELHEKAKPDVWILHNVVPVISVGIYSLAQELGVPIIQWLHNYRPFSPSGTLSVGEVELDPDDPLIALKESLAGTWNGQLATAWLGLALSHARWRRSFDSVVAWVAVSERMRSIFQLAGFRPDKLFTLRHSWNVDGVRGTEPDQGYFLFLGRMVEGKGVRFLVDLWRRPELAGIRLVMAGVGPLVEALKLHSPPNVEWVGFVRGEAKRRLLAGCRAVVFPSIWSEPLSTVAYEAFEAGKPILVSDRGGMAEIVLDYETGYVLPALDCEVWLRAILTVSSDHQKAKTLGRNGREWLENNVGASRWNEGFDKIIERIEANGSLRARPVERTRIS